MNYLQNKRIKFAISILLLGAFIQSSLGAPIGTQKVRIKDLARIQGVQRMDLIGYGVVVGLRGTGDKDIALAKQTISNLMKNFNIFIDQEDLTSKNVAVVMLTSSIDPFHRKGDRIDVQVASMGDASSLSGGILLMTPMLDAEGKVYAMAQGALIVGGFSVGQGGAGGATETKNFPTVGRIPNGATLRYDHNLEFIKQGVLDLVLLQPDFTTAQRVADAVNTVTPGGAVAEDAGTISIRIPSETMEVGLSCSFIASIESLKVTPDMRARVLVNERTGTIVLGGDVSIGTAIVAHGNLTVRVGSTLNVSQPSPFSRAGGTAVTEDVNVQVKEDKANVLLVPQTSNVQELADVLNQLGASPRDLISILEALQALGALQVEIVTL